MSQYVVWWSAGDWWILFLTVLLSTSLLVLSFLTVSIHASRILITLSLVSVLWNSRGLTFFTTFGTLRKLQWLAVIWLPEVNFSKNETLHTVGYVQLQREIWPHESGVFAVVASTLGLFCFCIQWIPSAISFKVNLSRKFHFSSLLLVHL